MRGRVNPLVGPRDFVRRSAPKFSTAKGQELTRNSKEGYWLWTRPGESEPHREDGPAIIWDEGVEEWYRDGLRHREDGPAVTDADGTEEWWQDDQVHRVGGPAITRPGYRTEWYQHDKRHREDGPAVIREDGVVIWYQEGLVHRDDGPALIWPSGKKEWFHHDKRHREDGPAVEDAAHPPQYFLDHQELSYDEFLERTSG